MATAQPTMTITKCEVRENYKRTRAHVNFSIEGESLLESFVNRGSEPHNLVKNHVLPQLSAYGVLFDKAVWSRRAGCRCGCSPAFILDKEAAARINGHVRRGGFDVYLTVKVEMPADWQPEPAHEFGCGCNRCIRAAAAARIVAEAAAGAALQTSGMAVRL